MLNCCKTNHSTHLMWSAALGLPVRTSASSPGSTAVPPAPLGRLKEWEAATMEAACRQVCHHDDDADADDYGV